MTAIVAWKRPICRVNRGEVDSLTFVAALLETAAFMLAGNVPCGRWKSNSVYTNVYTKGTFKVGKKEPDFLQSPRDWRFWPEAPD
jgi:hypothetical protein